MGERYQKVRPPTEMKHFNKISIIFFFFINIELCRNQNLAISRGVMSKSETDEMERLI